MSVLFLFIDGMGLGDAAGHNPLYTRNYESLRILSGGEKPLKTTSEIKSDRHVFKGVDANLGIEGLPQSGTGQTALFTGANAAEKIGKHFGPFPHSGIKPLLKKESIFHDLQRAGLKPHFMNAYPPVFFEKAEKRNRWSCTTLMTKSAGLKLNSTEEVLGEKALTAEIVQNAWREKLGIDLPKIEASDAGRRILNILPDYDLLLYEYYLTDKAGHTRKEDAAVRVMDPLDELLMTLLKGMRSQDLLVLCSDHGNLEDLSVKTHTRNPVPLYAWGNGAGSFEKAESIMDVKSLIIHSIKD